MRKIRVGRFASLATALAAAASHAGVKYWTNPDFKVFDADCYVQDGLLLHYDGIRNAGLGQEHSTSATTWVNLGSGGSANDATAYSRNTSNTSTSWTKGSIENGEWTDDGFHFNQRSRWEIPGTFSIDRFTLQLASDITRSAAQDSSKRMYAVFGNGKDSNGKDAWKTLGVATLTGTGWGNGAYVPLDNWGYSKRPSIPDATVKYLTAAQDDSALRVVSGTSLSDATAANYGYISGRTVASAVSFTGICLGSNGTGSQALTGTIKDFRLYSRVLDEDELVWNRAIDDYRFFGASAPATLPATNAVIVSSAAAVQGTEPSGLYAVDEDGYTFTAPASQTVNGRAYACTGYTLETSTDGGATWSDPVLQDGVLAVQISSTDCKRITWQWTAGDGIVTRYTAADYVQDGLLLHYDGIENVGAYAAHSSAPVAWVNLAQPGSSDLSLVVNTAKDSEPGEWRADGYRFEGESRYASSDSFAMPSNRTIQIALEGNGLDQDARNTSGAWVNEPYLYYAGMTFNNGGAISLRRDNNSTGREYFDWSTHGYGDDNARPSPAQPVGTPMRYVTAVLADDYSAAFLGTEIPTAETGRYASYAVRRAITTVPTALTASYIGIGGCNNNTRMCFRGVIHNFRLYNRVLTDEELAQNRMIDDYRFHGVIPVTNIVVATSHAGLEGAEKSGPYEISGSWTFTAPANATDARGIAYACTGCTLETWDATAQCWGEPVLFEGRQSFAYSTSAGLVRLTWQWQATGALFTAADYDVSDYVAGGLLLHYDGLQNLSAESADSSNPTSAWSRVWNNIAPGGGNAALYQSKVGTEGSWNNDGFTYTVSSFFKATDGFVFSPKCTHQTLVDGIGDCTDNGGSLSGSSPYRGYVMYADPWNKAGSFSFVSDDKHTWIDLAAHGFSGGSGDTSRCDPIMPIGTNLTYATGIMGDGYMAAFYGTEIPSAKTTRWTNPSRLSTSHLALAPSSATAIYLGSANSGQPFIGTVKNYRYYDRALTEAELVRNRQVDSARYFGELAFTNVVVATKYSGEGETLATPPGAYFVEGSWTFSATKICDYNGNLRNVAGCWVYPVASDGTLGAKSWSKGASYTYNANTAASGVRIVWAPPPTGLTIILR